MALRPATAVGAVALVAIALSVAPARAAAPSTVSGKLSQGTAKLPKSGKKGRAQVIAMNVDTLAFADAATVDRRGRYKLTLPAGKWALRSSVVALGKKFVAFSSARIATRAGKRRSLPLTLKRFKKPRKRARRRAHARRSVVAGAANVNPRDGVAYAGEAYAIQPFALVGGGSDLQGFAKGMATMLITELVDRRRCAGYTIVEWARREAVQDELALSRTEYVDPAARVEEGHLIDPEVFVRGRVEDRPGTPRRVAMIAWLEDAKTGAKISGEVSAVTLHENVFGGVKRLGELIGRDLICPRAAPPPPPPEEAAPQPAGPDPEPGVCVAARSSCSPPGPPPGVYTGTFSGEADAAAANIHYTWNGTLRLDAAQDDPQFPPHGAPPGSYRVYSVTSGGVDMTVVAGSTSDCRFEGTRPPRRHPGPVQLADGPARRRHPGLRAPDPGHPQ